MSASITRQTIHNPRTIVGFEADCKPDSRRGADKNFDLAVRNIDDELASRLRRRLRLQRARYSKSATKSS